MEKSSGYRSPMEFGRFQKPKFYNLVRSWLQIRVSRMCRWIVALDYSTGRSKKLKEVPIKRPAIDVEPYDFPYCCSHGKHTCLDDFDRNRTRSGFAASIFNTVHARVQELAVVVLFIGLQSSNAMSQTDVTHLDGFEISPEIISTPILTATEAVPYSYQVEIRNPDGFAVESFLEESPAGMVIDSETGLVEWQAPLAGVYPVEIVVIDSRGRLDLQIYDLTVEIDVSGTLEIVSEPESQALLNSLYQYQVVAEGETEGAQYSLTISPGGMTIDTANGLVSWIADAVDTHPVSINVTNTMGQSAGQVFDLEILAREPGETVEGELAGLHDGELVIHEASSDQYFALSEDGQFSLETFETGQSYLFEIAGFSTSKQNCVLRNEQGLLPQETGDELIIQCTAGDVTAEDLLESIAELETSGELTPAEEIFASEFADNQQSDARSREIDRAHALVLSAEDPDPDWMGTQIQGDQVIVTSPGSVHTVSGSKFNADGDITGPIDTSMLRFEIRLQRLADEIEWVPRELAEDMVFWTGNPGEFQVHVPADLEHGRLIVGLRPNFEDPGVRATAERWSQAVIFEIWPVRPGVTEFDPGNIVFPRSGDDPMAAGSAFSIEELEQRVDAEFANDNLVMPLIVDSAAIPEVGDLVDHKWNGDPYGGRIISKESRSGQTLLLLSPEWNAVYDVMGVEEGFLEKHGVLPSVIAYRIGDEVVPGFDERYRDPVESLTADTVAPNVQSSPDDSRAAPEEVRSSRSAGSDLFIRTCDGPASRPILAVSNKFKLSPPEASVSLTVATGERASTLDIDCSWQANPDKRFAMPLVVAGPAGVIAQKLFGTEVGVRPTGKVILDARAEVSALLAFKASFSTRDGLQTNMPELPRTSLAFDSLDGPPIQLSNRIGSDLGVVFFANALSTRGILGKLARLFTSDEIEIGVEASVSLGIGVGFSGANAAAVHQGASSQVFTDLKFCAKVGINASLLRILRSIVGNATVDVELFCRTFKAAIGPEAPFTFDQVQDDFEGNAVATGLSAGSVFELVFGRNASGIVAPSNRSLFESIFDDRHDSISYDLAECPDRNSSAGGGAPDRITGDLIVCAHSLVCGKADKQVELCGTGLSISPVTASGFFGEQVSAEGKIKALSPRGLLDAIEVNVSGDPLSPQISPLRPLMLSSSRPERPLSFESQCEAQGVTRGQSEIQTFVENILPGHASNIRVCRCDPGDRDCDRIWGSPHLLTADGLALDYYASGDYVLARADGQQPIEVQGRFLPGYDVSWPQAVALKVGSDIVEIHTDTFNSASTVSHRLRIWVNGVEPVEPGRWQPFRNTRVLRLPDGGLIILEAVIDRFLGGVSDPSRVLVLMPKDHEFPDFGVRVQSLMFDQSEASDFRDTPPILSVSMLRGESILGRDSGLLGSNDADETNDLTLRGGSVIAFTEGLTWTELYAQFGASWLVRPYECLFRNGCIDPQFPQQPALVDPERRQFAEAACFGLEGWYREACIHDVGLSGSAELVQGLYRNVEDLNFMADRIKRPGADFAFLTLNPGPVDTQDHYELHRFTVERVEGQGPYMLTVRPPRNTTAVLHSTGGGSLINSGDMLVDAVQISCIPDPEWAELGVAWPLEGSLQLWVVDAVSGTAEVKLGEIPLPADRLNHYCTGIRAEIDSEFLRDAALQIGNVGDTERFAQLRPADAVEIAAPALERFAVCPTCDVRVELGTQCKGGLQRLGMLDILDASGELLESRELICATPAGSVSPRLDGSEGGGLMMLDDQGVVWDQLRYRFGQHPEGNFFDQNADLYWPPKAEWYDPSLFDGRRIVQVAAGGSARFTGRISSGGINSHFLALDDAGGVWVWGHNNQGQLGLPSCAVDQDPDACAVTGLRDFIEFPVRLDAARLPATIKQIVSAKNTSYAVDTDGRVWSWGANLFGELGAGGAIPTGRTGARSEPGLIVQPADGFSSLEVVAIAADSYTAFAVTRTGRLFAWGHNYSGQAGTGSTSTFHITATEVLFPTGEQTEVVGIFAGDSTVHAIDSTGRLWGWGLGFKETGQADCDPPWSKVDAPLDLSNLIFGGQRFQWAMSGTVNGGYAVDFYGDLWAWGCNFEGELGIGSVEVPPGPVRVDLSGLDDAAVVAGIVQGPVGVPFVLDDRGRLWGWGPAYQFPAGLDRLETLPVLVREAPETRPTVQVDSFEAGEWLVTGANRRETIAVVEVEDLSLRRPASRTISISHPGLVFAGTGTSTLEVPRGRKVRDAILATGEVLCAAPGLISVAFDLNDEDGAVLASHQALVDCQYPLSIQLGKALHQSTLELRNDWTEPVDLVVSELDGLTHEVLDEQVVSLCGGCGQTLTVAQVCPAVGRRVLVRVEIGSVASGYAEQRNVKCGRTNHLIATLRDATLAVDYTGQALGWGRAFHLGVGDDSYGKDRVIVNPEPLPAVGPYQSGIGTFSLNHSRRGAFTFFARDANGSIWAWGRNEHGELGIGRHRVTDPDASDAAAIDVTTRVAGALSDAVIGAFDSQSPTLVDRRGRAWRMGSNQWGKDGLGNLVPADHPLPVAVDVPVPIDGIVSTNADFGYPHLALSPDGLEIWAWGGKTSLMGPVTEEHLDNCILEPASVQNPLLDDFKACEPLKVTASGLGGHPVRDLVSSGGQALALSADGRVWNWGRTFEITDDGLYDRTNILEPREVDLAPLQGARVIGLATAGQGGQFVNFLYDENGSLWTMGIHFGLFGTGSSESFSQSFQKVAFPPEAGRIVELSLASDYALAVDDNHCFWAWGQNASHDGQGNPLFEVTAPRSTVFTPVPVLPALSSPGCPLAIRPAITSEPELDIIEGAPYVYQAEIDNPNGFPVEFQLDEAPSGMVVDADSGLLEWPAPEVGWHTVELKAMDSRGLFDEQQFELRVVPGTFEVVSSPQVSILQNSRFSYQVNVSGSSSGLELSLQVAPAGMEVGDQGNVTWVADELGEHPVSILVSNAFGQSATQEFTIEVMARDGKHQLTGELIGLRYGALLIQDVESGQYFELTEDGEFTLGPFAEGDPYSIHYYRGEQYCTVENWQGIIPQPQEEEMTIECEEGTVSRDGGTN